MNDREYWERHARRYDRSMIVLGRPMHRMLELTAEAVSGAADALEVAAGTGLVTTAIAPGVGRLVATDYAESMVALLRDRVQTAGVSNVVCAVSNIYELQWPPASFDAVVAANVLHLLPDLARALDALRRVLRPDGKLVAPTYCHDETRMSRLVSRLLSITGFPASRRFTAMSLETALEREGFEVQRRELISGLIPIAFIEAVTR